MTLTKVERVHAYSPLRYPGGKTGLMGFFRKLIRTNRLHDVTYVEPYAGGAGAALGLLISGQVERIVINDLDPAISAFWKAAIYQHTAFSEKVRDVQLSVDEWQRQKDIYRNRDSHDLLEVGFSVFFLNRTNRSGVLNAGPIGGLDQTGNYKIDARFNRETLLERIRLLGLYRSRIEVTAEDGVKTVERHINNPNTLVYADPPYFEKGSSLYLNSFGKHEHQALADCLNSSASGRWVLTYDNVREITELYSKRRRIEFSLSYSVHSAKKATEIMIFSDSLVAPESENDWSLNDA